MMTRRFPAMGTRFEIHVEAHPSAGLERAIDAAVELVEELEAKLSRFRPDSELSVLNRLGSATVSEDLVTLTQLALDARQATGGRFDPTVHNAMIGAGYAVSFTDMPAGAAATMDGAACAGRVDVSPRARAITLGPGVALDLGGIAKGYAAERLCNRLTGFGPCLVNAGGDIAIGGIPAAGVWTVRVPTTEAAITLGLRNGGLATSGVDRRRWQSNGRLHHHIIDPTTGRPAATDVVRVTVVADSATRAEALATALVIEGANGAISEAEARSVSAIVVTDADTFVTRDLK